MIRLLPLVASILLLAAQALAGQPVVGLVTGSPGLGDRSFNDMAHAGVEKARLEFGFSVLVHEPKVDPAEDARGLAEIIGRSDTLVLLGGQHLDAAQKAALAHPEKTFILLDARADDRPNLSSVLFRQHEGAFLAGALAAMVSGAGKIGFVGGAEIPPVRAFEQGYKEGAAYADPKTLVLVDYTSPAGDYSGFGNPEKGRQLAMGQYAKGADIVFAVAGQTGNGVIEAARAAGKLAIGVDADQDGLAEGHVLTSMMKRLDVAAYAELKSVMEKSFKPGLKSYGLDNGGVGLSEMRHTRDKVPEAVHNKIQDISSGIVAKTIPVTDLLARP